MRFHVYQSENHSGLWRCLYSRGHPGLPARHYCTTDKPGQGLFLGIFAVNAAHNVVHLVAGAILVWGGLSAARVTTVNKFMAVVFAVLVPVSFIAPIAEGVAINVPDTLLHLVSALLTGYLGFMAGPSAVGPARAMR
jgi:hypothetical protein